mgnify:CR=1 FL=1
MSEKAEKLQWHPAFCAATELELRQDLDVLELIPEYNFCLLYTSPSPRDA